MTRNIDFIRGVTLVHFRFIKWTRVTPRTKPLVLHNPHCTRAYRNVRRHYIYIYSPGAVWVICIYIYIYRSSTCPNAHVCIHITCHIYMSFCARVRAGLLMCVCARVCACVRACACVLRAAQVCVCVCVCVCVRVRVVRAVVCAQSCLMSTYDPTWLYINT